VRNLTARVLRGAIGGVLEILALKRYEQAHTTISNNAYKPSSKLVERIFSVLIFLMAITILIIITRIAVKT